MQLTSCPLNEINKQSTIIHHSTRTGGGTREEGENDKWNNRMASNALRLASTSSLREIRLHLCQKSAASAGVRDFISKHYVDLKKANPKFPILIRECSGITPRVWARYTYGQEQSVDLTNKSAADVLKTLTSLAKS